LKYVWGHDPPKEIHVFLNYSIYSPNLHIYLQYKQEIIEGLDYFFSNQVSFVYLVPIFLLKKSIFKRFFFKIYKFWKYRYTICLSDYQRFFKVFFNYFLFVLSNVFYCFDRFILKIKKKPKKILFLIKKHFYKNILHRITKTHT